MAPQAEVADRSWGRAWTMREALERQRLALIAAYADAMQRAGIPQGVREQVGKNALWPSPPRGDLDELWTAFIPDAGPRAQARPSDGWDLMRWRLVVPARMGEARALREVCAAAQDTFERLLRNAARYAAAEASARDAGDLKLLRMVQLRSAVFTEAAQVMHECLLDRLDMWDQAIVAERHGADAPRLCEETQGGLERTAPPLLDLAIPRIRSRRRLVAMAEQAARVREQLGGLAVRYAVEADSLCDPDSSIKAATARGLALAADLLEAALAAGAERTEDLGRHVAAHGRCVDQVI